MSKGPHVGVQSATTSKPTFSQGTDEIDQNLLLQVFELPFEPCPIGIQRPSNPGTNTIDILLVPGQQAFDEL